MTEKYNQAAGKLEGEENYHLLTLQQQNHFVGTKKAVSDDTALARYFSLDSAGGYNKTFSFSTLKEHK